MPHIHFYIQALIIGVFIAFTGCDDSVSDNPEEEIEEPNNEIQQPAQEIGINVNGQYNLLKFENVQRSGTVWVRGFLDFFQLYPDEANLDNDERVQNYIQLSQEGYKNILSIKWNFSSKSFPEPDSEEMEEYKSYLGKLLDKVWGHTEIIVIGNEPFIESKQNERDDRLVSFYKEIGNYIKEYREDSHLDIPIYVGAFNNLYLSGWRTQAVNDLLGYAQSNDWIAGIDVHIHHSGINQINDFVDYVDLRIRDNQKILISEFSIKDHFRSKMSENIPEDFASEYGYDSGMQNYQYLDAALKSNVSREEWVDFLSSSYWFENRKHYLANAFERFESYDKFHIAAYALRQSYPFNQDFTANTTPWILNGLFANRTVKADPETGQDQFNYAWIEDFKGILEDSNE